MWAQGPNQTFISPAYSPVTSLLVITNGATETNFTGDKNFSDKSQIFSDIVNFYVLILIPGTATFGEAAGARFVLGQLSPMPPVVTPPIFWSQTTRKLHITWRHITGGGGLTGS